MNFRCLTAGLLCLASISAMAGNVACVGNSITYGYGLSDGKYSYPTRLQEMLGQSSSVSNFGVSSMTFSTYGSSSYWSTDRFTAAMNSNPDTVVIELGTNDSKFFMGNYPDLGLYNWAYGLVSQEDLKRDYRALIDTFAHLGSQPEIYATLQPYSNNVSWTITDTAIVNVINPIIFDAAVEKGVNIIDLHTLFYASSWYLSDSVHPNDDGANELAKIIYKYITSAKPVITASGSTLSVNSGYGFFWYKDGVLISGANSQTYKPTAKGSYSALVKVDDSSDSYLLAQAVEADGSDSGSETDFSVVCVNSDKFYFADSALCGAEIIADTIYGVGVDGNTYKAVSVERADNLGLNDVYPIGATALTWTFSYNGLTASCPQIINVADSFAPVFDCYSLKDVVYVGCDDENRSDTMVKINIDGCFYYADSLFAQDCQGNVAGTLSYQDTDDLMYPYNLIWTFTDPSGNSKECVQGLDVVKTEVESVHQNVGLSYENGSLCIADNAYGLLSVLVYDMQGRLVTVKDIMGGAGRVELGLRHGVYVAVLTCDSDVVASLKFIE